MAADGRKEAADSKEEGNRQRQGEESSGQEGKER